MSISSHFYSVLNRITETAYPYVKDATTTQVATTVVGVAFGLYCVPQIVCCLCCSKKMKGKKVERIDSDDFKTSSSKFERTPSWNRLYDDVPKQSGVPESEVKKVVALFSGRKVEAAYRKNAWFIKQHIKFNENVTKFSKLTNSYFTNLFFIQANKTDSYLLHDLSEDSDEFAQIYKAVQRSQEHDLGLPLIAVDEKEKLLLFSCTEDTAHNYAYLMNKLRDPESQQEKSLKYFEE